MCLLAAEPLKFSTKRLLVGGRERGGNDPHWCQIKAFPNLVSSLWAGNAIPGGRTASKGGGSP